MTDNWETPGWLMELFKDWFDPCPINADFDGLDCGWQDKTYVNPPYSSPLKWVLKAIEENKKGKTIAMLLKVDTSTRVYRELVNAKAHILFINERLKFKGIENHDGKPASFPSMLVILK